MTPRKNSLATKANKIKQYLPLYLMMLPALIYLLINNYLPMTGLVLAFKKYTVQGGIWGSEWNGLKNFVFMTRSKEVPIVIRNTLGYNFCFILINMVVGVFLAIMITEIGNKKLQKFAQSSVLFPFVVSIIIVSYMVRAFLDSEAGLVNSLLASFGGQERSWYDVKEPWPYILVFVNLWKGVGYSTILYISTILGVDPALYEAARLAGASKWQQIRYITLPFLKPTVITMMLLNVGPRSDGTVTDEETAVLQEIGRWMKINSDGIYDTTPWKWFGEGSVNAQDGFFMDGEEKGFSSDDFRFTYKGGCVYAFQLRPDGMDVQIKTFAEKGMYDLCIEDVSLLGYNGTIHYQRNH